MGIGNRVDSKPQGEVNTEEYSGGADLEKRGFHPTPAHTPRRKVFYVDTILEIMVAIRIGRVFSTPALMVDDCVSAIG